MRLNLMEDEECVPTQFGQCVFSRNYPELELEIGRRQLI